MDNGILTLLWLDLGNSLWHPNKRSYCRSQVVDLATYSLSCQWSGGRHPRHAAINNVIQMTLSPAKLLPSRAGRCIYIYMAKTYPDGFSIMPWQFGKAIVWDSDIICPDTSAPQHLHFNRCPRQPERLVQRFLSCSSRNTPHSYLLYLATTCSFAAKMSSVLG